MTSAAAPGKHRSGATEPMATEPIATEPMVRRFGRAVLGRQPIGMIFGAPYLLFIVVLFAYPLGLAVYMSFHRYFFTAPGVSVPRPFVGLSNYAAVFSDPAVRQSFLNLLIFLVINVPFTVVLSLLLATALNAAIPFRAFFRTSFLAPYVTASVAMIGTPPGLVLSCRQTSVPDPATTSRSTVATAARRRASPRRPELTPR